MKADPRLLVAALLATTIAGCDSDGGIINYENGGAPTVTTTTVTGASDAASSSLLNYTMPDINGGIRRENAVVMIPAGNAPADGWPVIGWGHGTVGVADSCAPSATDNLSGYDSYLNSWLASGYAIVAPDYEGLGTNGGHPFLHLDSEGRSINYAVDAATQAFPELSKRYALLGHSQGGHAVLGAASLSDENPGITLVAAVALAPASQILAQGDILQATYANTDATDLERVGAAVGSLGFSALLAHGVKSVLPDFDADSYYGADGEILKQATETTCLSQLSTDLATSVPAVLLSQNSVASFIDPAIDQDETLLRYFESVEPGNRVIEAPLLLAQGLADVTVLASSTIALTGQLSSLSDTDTDPQLITYEGASHTGVLQQSFNEASAFISTEFANQQ